MKRAGFRDSVFLKSLENLDAWIRRAFDREPDQTASCNCLGNVASREGNLRFDRFKSCVERVGTTRSFFRVNFGSDIDIGLSDAAD